jgi:hypothetical protein
VARNMYGATSADFTLTSGGRVVPGATLTIWSARTGGTQITDLLDVDSVATTTVTSDADGSIVYYGPNNDKTVHWADSGVGNRIAVRPTDITGDPPVLSIGTVGTGTAAASLTGTSEAPVLNLTLPSAGANGVNTAAIQDGAVTSAKIADGTITATQIAANAVGSSELADNAVDTAALADGSVTSAKIAGRALTALTPDAVLSSNLGPAIGSWTAVGSATFSTGTWTVPTGSGISATIAAVTDATIYQVDVTQSAGAPLTVTLGSVTQIFGAAQNSVTVVSSGTGSQTLTVTVGSAASITGVTVRSVITPASPIGLGQVEARLRAYNNAIGVDAQRNLTTGTYNNAIGVSAQYNLTTGYYNNAIGGNAQYSLTTGYHNNAIGVSAQRNLTTGYYNNAIGGNAQYSLTTGAYNNAIGVNAQRSLTTGTYNNAIGVSAQYNLTTGSNNNAIGVNAQYSLTTGSNNNAIGVNAQYNLTTGSNNNAIGVSAQYNLTTGSNNNAIGVSAQYNLTTGSNNTALGHGAGSNITVQSGTVCIGVDYSGTAAQASADNDFVLGTGLHNVLIPGSLETTGNDKGVIVRSPNGTRWRLGVSNAGAVTVVAA